MRQSTVQSTYCQNPINDRCKFGDPLDHVNNYRSQEKSQLLQFIEPLINLLLAL